MYRKDFIEAEIQKLSQVLARILGLKQEGKIEEAHQLIHQSLENDYGFSREMLNSISVQDMEALLQENKMTEPRLNILAQLLFESAHPFEDVPEINNRLHLVLLVFNHLEENYHVQSLENVAKREMIDKFLNLDQYG